MKEWRGFPPPEKRLKAAMVAHLAWQFLFLFSASGGPANTKACYGTFRHSLQFPGCGYLTRFHVVLGAFDSLSLQ
jgi:hypothetical protein